MPGSPPRTGPAGSGPPVPGRDRGLPPRVPRGAVARRGLGSVDSNTVCGEIEGRYAHRLRVPRPRGGTSPGSGSGGGSGRPPIPIGRPGVLEGRPGGLLRRIDLAPRRRNGHKWKASSKSSGCALQRIRVVMRIAAPQRVSFVAPRTRPPGGPRRFFDRPDRAPRLDRYPTTDPRRLRWGQEEPCPCILKEVLNGVSW